ncbi:Lrp/AsnC ligand binding domain-containing protein [Rhizobium leguminosarum]|uniref:Lrp/AsnC ligand binding domain-containing protein n=1 Tax=Rhizobium leguminosarum TaxID=384 RepID=UPI0028F40FF0|nr:Lrp/AsnC ligand binding domain-containing protein [Rhizobium leguminosarum]
MDECSHRFRRNGLFCACKVGASIDVHSACVSGTGLRSALNSGLYAALLDTSNEDAMIASIINITLERQTEDHLDRFEAAVRRHPEIRECYLMTGGSDYLLRVEVAGAGEFERIHKEILSTLPGVLRIHSSFSIRNVLATRTRGRR